MIYALNVFNLIPGKEDDYRAYSIKAGKIIYGLGGKVVSAGTDPIREMHGDRTRRQMIVVEFPGLEGFERFIDEAETRTSTPCGKTRRPTTSGHYMSPGT
jgi:uncharacterized protein (DUF1330 family)